MTDVEHDHAEALKQMEAKIDELPVLPQVLVRLLQLKPTAEDYFESFEGLAKEDPAFAVRVIALANSATSSPVSPIETIREAMARMGATRIGALVASLAVQKVFMPTEEGQVRLWIHSIYAAVAAEAIAGRCTALGLDPGKAYLAGLLHDIGRFVMLEHAAPCLKAVDESNWTSPEELVAADVEVYKFTHSELGFLACQRWALPEELSQAVRDHHSAVGNVVEPGSLDALNYCIQIADRLCMNALECDGFEMLDADQRVSILEAECLAPVSECRIVTPEMLDALVPFARRDGGALLSNLGFAESVAPRPAVWAASA